MRNFLLILVMAVGLVGVAQGKGEVRERVVNGLLEFGHRKLEQALEKRAAKAEAKAQQKAQEQAAAAGQAEQAGETEGEPKPRTWRDRGREMLGAFVGTAIEGIRGEGSANEVLGFSLKATLDVVINEYKEQYKKEGREYARELGDRMVERVKADPKISGTLTAIEALCWGIVGYLSFVTLFVFFALFMVLRGQKKLRRGYDDLAKKIDELRAAVSIKTK